MMKGIDAQQIVTQTYMTEKVQQVQQRQADMQQRYFDVQLAEERRRLQEKIQQAEDAEKAKLREKKHERDKEKEHGGHQDQGGEFSPDDQHVIDLRA
jgi:hypothetical protein